MKKALSIAWKDTLILFSDPAALVFMLLAPFLLTLAMGAVSGSFSQNASASGGIADVPVILINLDQGELGGVLVDVFLDQDLFLAEEMTDEAAARQKVQDDDIAAVVLIPDDFSASMLAADPASGERVAAPVEIYGSPNRPISTSIIRSVVSSVISQIEIAPAAIHVTTGQLIENGLLAPVDAPQFAGQLAADPQSSAPPQLIRLSHSESTSGQDANVNAMAYLAPSMAIFFLMYTVTQGARSILFERERGTMARMLSTPTSSGAILVGKLLGIFLAGFAQVLVLIVVSAGIFQLNWGQPVAVIGLVAATVLAATGWGLLIAAFARQSWQVASFGSALMLLFGILGGSFIPVSAFNEWMRLLSKITPHAWAADAFLKLGTGSSLPAILPNLLALLVMAAVLLGASTLIAGKRWVK